MTNERRDETLDIGRLILAFAFAASGAVVSLPWAIEGTGIAAHTLVGIDLANRGAYDVVGVGICAVVGMGLIVREAVGGLTPRLPVWTAVAAGLGFFCATFASFRLVTGGFGPEVSASFGAFASPAMYVLSLLACASVGWNEYQREEASRAEAALERKGRHNELNYNRR